MVTTTEPLAWRATRPVDLLLPELAWEGADLPLAPSLRGELDVRARELRDPYAWREGEDLYLIYVGGGEKAIGLSRLIPASGN